MKTFLFLVVAFVLGCFLTFRYFPNAVVGKANLAKASNSVNNSAQELLKR